MIAPSEIHIRPLVAADYPAVKGIIGESFTDHIRENPEALEQYESEPWYDPGHLLVAELGGRVVSQMGIRDGVMWIQGRPVSAGLLGTVCTAAEHRGMGIGALLLKGAFEWIDRRGLTVSYLHTSPSRYAFYGRQGYRLADMFVPGCQFHRPSGEISANPGVRAAAASDVEACNLLYEQTYGIGTGAWSRTPAFWLRRLQCEPKLWLGMRPEFFVVGEGVPKAYLALDRDGCGIVEMGGMGLEIELLVREAFEQTGSDLLSAPVNERSPFWDHLRAFRPKSELGLQDVMIRVHDEDAFYVLAAEILEAHAATAGLQARVQCGERMIEAGDTGEQLVARMSIHDLCSLIYNGSKLDALVEQGDVDQLSGSPDSLRRLFPETGASRCLFDGY